MSVKQFEEFLVEHFLNWTDSGLSPGFRYQFKSPNTKNSRELYRSFMSRGRCAGVITTKGVRLAYINCRSVKLIPVIHRIEDNSEEVLGYTENFISFLRDEVAGQKGEFEGAALLIIHNSLLDTIVNSAEDLTLSGAVFDPSNIKSSLASLIDTSDGVDGVEVSKVLLDYQFDLIIEDKGSMFGFESLYTAIADGNIRFDEIDLLNDPAILTMSGEPGAIRRRLDGNRALRDEILDVIEHYPDQLNENLPDFSEGFINKHFKAEDPSAWKSVTYDEFTKEQVVNREQNLEIIEESSVSGELIVRSKNASKTAQKDRHILLVVEGGRNDFDLSITFDGSRIKASEVLVRDKCRGISKENITLTTGSRNTSLVVTGPMRNHPRFFMISLNRAKTSEKFKFKCLVVRSGDFNVESIKNSFLINTTKQFVTLQTQETTLDISLTEGGRVTEVQSVGQKFSVLDQDTIDFETLSNEVDRIDFCVVSGEASLKFDVEGAAATESLIVPLLFDQSRGLKLFSDTFLGVYNRAKNRIYIDNKEVKAEANVLSYLSREASLVDGACLFINDVTGEQLTISDLVEIDIGLANAFSALYEYYDKNKTLPSLCGWGPKYQRLVQSVVSSYHKYLSEIADRQYLGVDHKSILTIGMWTVEDSEYLTPVHPLVLGYYLNLVEQAVMDETSSYLLLPNVTMERLNPQGLIPFIYDAECGFSYVKAVTCNCFWLHCVPNEEANYDFVIKLVKDKISEFSTAFKSLFEMKSDDCARPTLIINSVNNYENKELFLGVVEHIVKQRTKTFDIHVNIYDDDFQECEFDRFSEMASYEKIKSRYELNKGAAKEYADTIVDLLRTRVTYSKFTHGITETQDYAHLTFFRNNQKVKVVNVDPDERLSGVSCHGLINGEASASEQGNYITGFGLNKLNYKGLKHVEIAALLGRMFKPARGTAIEYRDNSAIALAVDDKFKTLLERSYSSSIWTSIIDPKVTLEFFENSKDMLLIHYSDQYTSSASYDAITVTRQTDLYDRVLEKDEGGIIGEFNAFNGEWLLKMITDNEKLRKERKGILAAYKLVSCLLANSDITWVPMSVAEMIRVSGNIGLKMSESEFSRHIQGYKSGAISDDVLFVGFKKGVLYLLPLEVKTGVGYDSNKAIKQAKELGRYLKDEVLNGAGLSNKLYRGLFIRQVLMQIDKYELYSVYPDDYFLSLLEEKEWWLQGDYGVSSINGYPEGFVVANLESDRALETVVAEVDGILKMEVPYSFLPFMVKTPLQQLLVNTRSTPAANIPDKYFLKSFDVVEKGNAELGTGFTEVLNADDEVINQPTSIENRYAVGQRAVEDEYSKVAEQEAGALPTHESLKVLIGHEVNHNKEVYWEPTNTAKFMNTNSGIIGTMGTGKTQCTKSVVTQLYRNQHNNVDGKPIGILIFDYKSDYVDDKFVTAANVKKYNLHKLPYNPLSLFGDTPMLPVHTARGFSETMGKAFGLGQKQQLKLRKLIGEAYELAGISKSAKSTWSRPAPTVADVWALFIEQEKVDEDSLYAALESLCELEIFEDDITKCTSLYKLINGVCVIELAAYPPQIQNLVVALTLDLFYSQMQKQGKPEVRGDFRQVTKLLLVDEADNFMSQNFPSLRKVLKEGREYGVGVILSTQDITHFKTKDNDYSSYILSWVIHRVSQIKNQDIKSLFNIDDKTDQDRLMNTIRELEKHYSLYVDGDKKVQKIKDKAFWELN